MSRPNLEVACRALVTRILFEGTRAVGVEYQPGFRRRAAARRARGEVILCGGAINSPQLLQLSGVGAAADLAALGIDVVADLPGVGENLQDHLEVYVQYASKLPVSVAPALKWRNRPDGRRAGGCFGRSGPGATNHFEGGGFVREQRRRGLPQPDVPLPAHRDPLRRLGPGRRARLPGAHRPDVLGLARHGQDHLPRPAVHPALRFNYLSTPTDRREWAEAIADRPATS